MAKDREKLEQVQKQKVIANLRALDAATYDCVVHSLMQYNSGRDRPFFIAVDENDVILRVNAGYNADVATIRKEVSAIIERCKG